MSLSLSLGCVETCALKNYVNADLSPRKLSSVSLSVDCKSLAVNCESTSLIISCYCVKVFTDIATVTALSCILLEKLSDH